MRKEASADLCLGRPSSSTRSTAPAYPHPCTTTTTTTTTDHLNPLLLNIHHHLASSDDDDDDSAHAQLQSYVAALRYERLKIDAFRAQLPFCIRLLDQAIQSSEVQLAQFTRCAIQQQQELQANSEDTLHGSSSWRPTNSHHQQQLLLLRPRSNCSTTHPNPESTGYSRSYNNMLEHIYFQRQLKLQQVAKENNDSKCFNKEVIDQQANVKNQRVQHHDINKDGEVARLHGYGFRLSTTSNDNDDSMISSSLNLQSSLQFSYTPNQFSNCANPITSDCQQQQQLMPGRKVRRRWSQELHQQFLQALQQLGGAQWVLVATPKQIREVMNVEGLTNDEVKSHLQKFRLHAKQPNGPQEELAPQQEMNAHPLVFFGGIWMPTDVPPIYGNANTCTRIH